MEQEGRCFFECAKMGTPLVDLTNVRKRKIISSSKKRRDDLHVRRKLELGKENIKCHRACVSTYTSKTHVSRHLKRKSDDLDSVVPDVLPAKRVSREIDKDFMFEKDCLICGKKCERDKKNPSREKKFSICGYSEATSLKKV